MSKQSIYVRHKDEIFNTLIQTLELANKSYEGVNKDYFDGYIDALKWVLGLDKTQEEKEKEFSNKIDALTNKGENNDSSNK
jgi:hypothetical protein